MTTFEPLTVEVVRTQSDETVFNDVCELPTAHLAAHEEEDCIQLWLSNGQPIIELCLSEALELADRIIAAAAAKAN